MGQFQHHPHAGAVVDGSVVIVVAAHRRIDSQMIVVCRIDDGLGGVAGVGAGQQSEHIVGNEIAHSAHDMRLESPRKSRALKPRMPALAIMSSKFRPEALNNCRATSSCIHDAALSFGSLSLRRYTSSPLQELRTPPQPSPQKSAGEMT